MVDSTNTQTFYKPLPMRLLNQHSHDTQILSIMSKHTLSCTNTLCHIQTKSCCAVAALAHPTHLSPGVLPDTIPFAFPDCRRFRDDYKRRWRRGPEGVAYSTSFLHPSSLPERFPRWRCTVGARIPSPVGADKAESFGRGRNAVARRRRPRL